MKNYDQNKKLKQLSDQHEVPFNPESWDKMEALLDSSNNTPPPPPHRGSSFFNFKNILAMIILLMILMFSIFPMGDGTVPDESTNIRESLVVAPVQENNNDFTFNNHNDTTKLETKYITETETKNTPQLGGGRDTWGNYIDPNFLVPYPISQQPPVMLQPTAPNQNQPVNIFTKTIPTEVSFVEDLEAQLAAYHKAQAEEKVYLHFDRTMLKPGESFWFSAYVRDANTLEPSQKSDIVYVEFLAPNGGVLKKLKLVTQKGIAKGDIQTSVDMVGGIYKIKAYTNWQRNFETKFERNITLQKTVLPHLRMELDFEREAYGANDEVMVKLDLRTLENTPLANFDFTYQVSLAGVNISNQKGKTDTKGHAELKFNLPKDLNTNDGLVNVMLQYNGQGESISRSIPIVLNKMDLQFFPEGGDLIAGFKQRIAFKAINEFGKPADVEGVITNSNGVIVSNFKSYHQGMGAFNFEPLYGEKYTAKITQPSNIEGTYDVPMAYEKGHSLQVVETDKDKVKIRVQSSENQSLTVVLQSQGKIINAATTTAQSGTHLIEIPTKDAPVGMAQVTMFDAQQRPHAERLVFLNPHKTLDIKISTNKDQYLPREKVSMNIEVKDENGKPVQGQFSVAVTDDKLLSYADDKQGRILAYMLLESDLSGEIEEPNFYFEPKEKHPDKDQLKALDFLMMTNGWRRFSWKNESSPIAGVIYKNEKAVIGGTVVDAFGEALKDVVVRIEGLDKTVITDATGKFTFDNVELFNRNLPNPNQITVVASKDGVSKILVNNYGENYQMKLNPIGNQRMTTKVIPSNGERKIAGQIFDENGEQLIGATVMLQGTTIGASTDIDGSFTINNVPEGPQVLVVSYTGYTTVEQAVSIGNNESLLANVTMPEGQVLDEVVVTSLGTNRRRNRRSKNRSTQHSKAKQAKTQEQPVVMDFRVPIVEQDDVAESLQGRVAGVVVTKEEIKNLPTRNINAVAAQTAGTTTSDEGEAIVIKGSRSAATDYYIDGVRVSGNLLPESELNQVMVITGGTPARFESEKDYLTERLAEEGGTVRQIRSNKKKIQMRGNSTILVTDEPIVIVDGDIVNSIALAKVKPNKIKSAKVIEGDVASNIYGSRGENGAIIIETQKRKLASVNQELVDYQNEMVAKVNEQVSIYQNQYNWALAKVRNGSLTAAETGNVRMALTAQLNKISSLKNVTAELGKLTGLYPATNYVERDFRFIEDFKYALSFKRGYYQSREFYVPKYVAAQKKIRDDFRPTIFWNPMVETDANGKAMLQFHNSDDLTTFKATVEGLTANGKIGNGTHTYFTQMPFGMRTKFPTQVLTGDKLTIPVTISNNTNEKMEVKLDALVPEGFEYVGEKLGLYSLDNQSVKTVYLPFLVKSEMGEHDLEVKVSANGESDIFSKKVKVLSRGFPVNMMFSGNDLEDNFDVKIAGTIEGSMNAKFTVYPTLMSDLSKGMERMIRQPTGCFEQTSSKNYPNLLVLDYLKSNNTLSQDLGARLYDVMEKGYQRLLTFEVQGGGFDWYGQAPAHEGLTAYGLMQFNDMKEVHRVEQDLIDRTAKWLLTRKDGKGGWLNSKRALHSWSTGNPAGDAYITWAMTEAGFGGQVREEIEKSYKDAKQTKDPYVMALVINTLHNINDGRANKLLQSLLKLQAKDGSWQGKTSMTRSGGKSLKIETTALTALAIMNLDEASVHLDKAMDFIASNKTDYGFGSTQSTVLAMKALVQHAAFSATMKTNGQVQLMIDGEKVAGQTYTSEQNTPIVFDEISQYLTNGNHDVKVLFNDTEVAMPYDLAVRYNTSLPKNDAECKVSLKTDLQNITGKIGETIRLSVELKNTTNEAVPNTIAKIGIPSGLNLQPWQLKELQEKAAFDFYEIMDGYLVLHYRGLEANVVKIVNLDLKANLAGNYEAPASVAYLYYTNEFRNWSKPDKLTIDN